MLNIIKNAREALADIDSICKDIKKSSKETIRLVQTNGVALDKIKPAKKS